jgi:hypothetical protein
MNYDLKILVLQPTDLVGRAHKEGSPLSLGSQGDPERGRTSDLQIRNLSLYPLSYGIVNWLVERLQIAWRFSTPLVFVALAPVICRCIINSVMHYRRLFCHLSSPVRKSARWQTPPKPNNTVK